MNLLLLNTPAKDVEDHAVNHQLSPLQLIIEGSEFRASLTGNTDHPPVYTEGCIAAGCPEDLF